MNVRDALRGRRRAAKGILGHHLSHARARALGIHLPKTAVLALSARIQTPIEIGEWSAIGRGSVFKGGALVSIGRFCTFGERLSVITSNHDMRLANLRYGAATQLGWQVPMAEPEGVVIGNAVWIGDAVTILPGTVVGDGAVIAAGSVVRGMIPAFHIAAGVPARIIRPRFSPKMIEFLSELQWWAWCPARLSANAEFFSCDLTVTDVGTVANLVRH